MNQDQYIKLKNVVLWAEQQSYKGRQDSQWAQDAWYTGSEPREANLRYLREQHKVMTREDFEAYYGVKNLNAVESAILDERYKCTSAYCIAGKLVLDSHVLESETMDELLRLGDAAMEDLDLDEDDISVNAENILGVDNTYGLFSGGNQLSDVLDRANMIAEEHGFPEIRLVGRELTAEELVKKEASLA